MKVRIGIDPFCEDLESWSRVKNTIDLISVSQETEIIPTFLLGFNQSDWLGDITQDHKNWVKKSARKKMEDQLSKMGVDSWKEPEIITVESSSTRKDIKHLAKILTDEKCDLFVANTHARKGLKRLLLGSFAENLLLHCETPMLFVTPQTDKVNKINRAVFPTDFSPASKAIFTKYLANNFGLAKNIELFSKTLYPHSYAGCAGSYAAIGPAWPAIQDFIAESDEKKRIEAKKWITDGQLSDVAVNFNVSDDPMDLIDSILQHVKKTESDMIILGSFVGGSEVIFTGSNTREIIRNSHVPVLVWHTDKD